MNKKKDFKSVLLALLLSLSISVAYMPAYMIAYAADDAAGQLNNSDAYSFFVGTDRHGSADDLVSVVNASESYVESAYSNSITKTIIAGDLVDNGDVSSAYSSSSGLAAVNDELRHELTWLDESGADSYYTYGNSHDLSVSSGGVVNHFLDSAGASGKTSPTRDTGVKELGSWGYLWGIDHFEMSDASIASTASEIFTSWVSSLPDDDHRVIVIASHVPMHARRGDNKGATIWLDAINSAAEDNDVLFFWGHNHTGWNAADISSSFVEPGGSITPQDGSATTINFTYALAGYIGKSVTDAWRGSSITVTDDELYVDHYSTSAHLGTMPISRKDVEPEPADSCDHEGLEHHNAVAATCEKEGNSEYWSCSKCGKYFSDKKCTTEIEQNSWIIKASGHDYSEYKLTKAATASRSGLLTKTCSKCGGKVTKVVSPIVAKVQVKSANKASITWKKVAGAERYLVYFGSCSKKSTMKLTATTTKQTFTKSGLKKGSFYKFKVKAQRKINGKWTTISVSCTGHFVAGNLSASKKYTNVKSISVAKAAVSLKVGKTSKIKPSMVLVKSGKKHLSSSHASAYRYLTTNSEVATVSSAGRITAKGKGSCRVYVVGVNGVYKAISVTVK